MNWSEITRTPPQISAAILAIIGSLIAIAIWLAKKYVTHLKGQIAVLRRDFKLVHAEYERVHAENESQKIKADTAVSEKIIAENKLDKLRELFDQGRRDLARVFRTVYGKDPEERDWTSLANLRCQPENEASDFRHVIGYFDHQFRHTPFSVRFAPADLSFMNVPEGFTLILDTADGSVSAYLLAQGEYEPHLVSFLKERVKPGMAVVDIGANIGFHAMLAARLVGAAGKVICFEPNSENCRLILLGADENQFGQVVLYPAAASNLQGYALFTTHVGSNGGLLPSTKETLLDPSCVVVPTFRLDDLIKEKVDLIKIDTEGAEGLVVSGAKAIIERYRPIVVSEFSQEMLQSVSGISGTEYLTYFQSIGYDLHLIDRKGGELQPILDIELFLDNYKPKMRIEDLAFIPK